MSAQENLLAERYREQIALSEKLIQMTEAIRNRDPGLEIGLLLQKAELVLLKANLDDSQGITLHHVEFMKSALSSIADAKALYKAGKSSGTMNSTDLKQIDHIVEDEKSVRKFITEHHLTLP